MTDESTEKVALITGGTSGIGRSAADKLAELGIVLAAMSAWMNGQHQREKKRKIVNRER